MFIFFSRYLRTGISFSGEVIALVDVIPRENPKAGSQGKILVTKTTPRLVNECLEFDGTEARSNTCTLSSVISRRCFADGGTELLSSACRTCRKCSTLIFFSFNQSCHWFVALSLPSFPSPYAWHVTPKSVKAIFRGAITCTISPIALEPLWALTEIGAFSIATQGIEVAFILFWTGAFIKICK